MTKVSFLRVLVAGVSIAACSDLAAAQSLQRVEHLYLQELKVTPHDAKNNPCQIQRIFVDSGPTSFVLNADYVRDQGYVVYRTEARHGPDLSSDSNEAIADWIHQYALGKRAGAQDCAKRLAVDVVSLMQKHELLEISYRQDLEDQFRMLCRIARDLAAQYPKAATMEATEFKRCRSE